MKKRYLTVECGITDCRNFAETGAILGTQRFCMVPVSDRAADPKGLVRYNLCREHLGDVRNVFTETLHDIGMKDYRDMRVFV